MLELHKLFDLTDIAQALYEASPKRTDKDVNVQEEKNLVLEGLANSNIQIVGQERDGIVLLTRIAYDKDQKKTFVDAYDMKKRSILVLYKHAGIVEFVSASLNADKTLLGFTLYIRGKHATADSYESYIVETLVGGSNSSPPALLGTKGMSVHKVQFIHTLDDKKTAYALCFLKGKNVTLYEIKRRPTVVRSKDVVGKALVWWSWDYYLNRLYIIDLKAKKNLCMFRAFQFPETSFVSVLSMSLPNLPNPNDIDLSFPYPYSFFAKPHQTPTHSSITLVKLPKNGNLCLCLQYSPGAFGPSFSSNSNSPINSPNLSQSGGSLTTQSLRNFREFPKSDQPQTHSSAPSVPTSPSRRMSGSGEGFQQQQLSGSSGNLRDSGDSSGAFESFFNGSLGDSLGSIEDEFSFVESKYSMATTNSVFVSVFILDIRRRVDISIPIDPNVLSPTTGVYFGSVENMLAIFIPGFYLTIIDCGDDHAPCFAGTLDKSFKLYSITGEDSANKMNKLKDEKGHFVCSTTVSPFCLVTVENRNTQVRSSIPTLLDCATGTVYSIQLSRQGLWDILTKEPYLIPQELLIHLIHIFTFHIGDHTNLINNIIAHAGNTPDPPFPITSPILRELIIGNSYRDMVKAKMDSQILTLLPATTLPILESHITKQHSRFLPQYQTCSSASRVIPSSSHAPYVWTYPDLSSSPPATRSSSPTFTPLSPATNVSSTAETEKITVPTPLRPVASPISLASSPDSEVFHTPTTSPPPIVSPPTTSPPPTHTPPPTTSPNPTSPHPTSPNPISPNPASPHPTSPHAISPPPSALSPPTTTSPPPVVTPTTSPPPPFSPSIPPSTSPPPLPLPNVFLNYTHVFSVNIFKSIDSYLSLEPTAWHVFPLESLSELPSENLSKGQGPNQSNYYSVSSGPNHNSGQTYRTYYNNSLRSMVSKFFSYGSNEPEKPEDDGIDHEGYQTGPPTLLFAEKFTEHVMRWRPREQRARVMDWGKYYRKAQIRQAALLYDCIVECSQDPQIIFHLLERLYVACESLRIPLPKGFHTTFAETAAYCLAPGVFAQYLERGVICVTTAFVDNILRPAINQLGHNSPLNQPSATTTTTTSTNSNTTATNPDSTSPSLPPSSPPPPPQEAEVFSDSFTLHTTSYLDSLHAMRLFFQTIPHQRTATRRASTPINAAASVRNMRSNSADIVANRAAYKNRSRGNSLTNSARNSPNVNSPSFASPNLGSPNVASPTLSRDSPNANSTRSSPTTSNRNSLTLSGQGSPTILKLAKHRTTNSNGGETSGSNSPAPESQEGGSFANENASPPPPPHHAPTPLPPHSLHKWQIEWVSNMLQHILSRYFASLPEALHNADLFKTDPNSPYSAPFDILADSSFFPVDVFRGALNAAYTPHSESSPQQPGNVNLYDIWHSLSYAIGTNPPSSAQAQEVEASTQTMVDLINRHIDAILCDLLDE